MKPTFVSSRRVLALGSAFVLPASFAGFVSLSVSSLCVLFSGVAALAILGLVCADYSRKPRFGCALTTSLRSHVTLMRRLRGRVNGLGATVSLRPFRSLLHHS